MQYTYTGLFLLPFIYYKDKARNSQGIALQITFLHCLILKKKIAMEHIPNSKTTYENDAASVSIFEFCKKRR